MTAGSDAATPELDGHVIAARPRPGTPRRYDFPAVAEHRLDNGLRVLVADLPGRPLISATLVLPIGAADEPAEHAGTTVLAARALTEGTEHYDAIALIEAGERLGASLHAEAGWDAMTIGLDVPADRLGQALALAADVALRPTFPAAEVERLRDERLNDLLQAKADPRRRAEETFIGTIYAAIGAVSPAGRRDRADRCRPHPGDPAPRLGGRARSPPGDARGRWRSRGPGCRRDRRRPLRVDLERCRVRGMPLRSRTRRRRAVGSFASSIGPGRSRPRSASGIGVFRVASRTSTRSA